MKSGICQRWRAFGVQQKLHILIQGSLIVLDEFLILLEEISSVEDVKLVAEKIMGAMSVAHLLGNIEKTISFSIGAAVYPDDAADEERLMQCADQAMYLAKGSGRNNFKFYQNEQA